jgi:hypothetical protein
MSMRRKGNRPKSKHNNSYCISYSCSSFLFGPPLGTSSLDAKFKMASSKIVFPIVAVMAASCAVVDGALTWGSFLGADWMTGEGECGGMRMSS